jgi:hypothetical protein
MTIGELAAAHNGKVIRMAQLPGARVLLGIRHFTGGDVARTSLLYREPSAGPKDPCSEYVGPSSTPVEVANA